MTRRLLLRCLLLALAILLFGAADALIKSGHGGTRNAVANVSAPWLLVPFLSAAVLAPRRLVVGASVGVLSTGAALATYAEVQALRGLHAGRHAHGLAALVGSSLANRWFLLGVVGGAALGVAGARLALHRQWMVVALVVGSVLMMEPVARITWALVKEEPARTLIPSPAVWALEVLAGGAAVCAVGLRSRRLSRRRC